MQTIRTQDGPWAAQSLGAALAEDARNPLARRLRRMPLAPWRSFEVAQHELRIAARICHWAVAIERGYHWEFSPVLRHLQASVSKQCPAASELGQFTNTPCPYFFRPHSAAAVIDEVKTS